MKTITSLSRRTALSLAAVLAFGLPASGLAAGPTLKFGETGELQLDYGLQVWGQNRSYTSATQDASSSDVYLRRNRITLSGQYNDIVGFYAQVEASNDSRAGNDDRSLYFRDAYLTLDYSDAARLIVGRFKNTFSRENLEACFESLTLDRGDISYTPFGGSRDTGIALWGNLADAAFQYRLMIADGREGETTPRSTPRVTARVHWSALDAEYDYGYRGTYLGTRKVLTLGAAYDYQAGVAYADYPNGTGLEDYSAWTVDGFFEYPFRSGTWTASAAYFSYSLGDAVNQSPDPELPANTESRGYYAKLGYLLPQPVGIGRLQFFARHDDVEYRLTGGALDRRITGAGVNYYFDGQRLKLTLEHQRIDYLNPDPANFALQDNHQTTLGLQFTL